MWGTGLQGMLALLEEKGIFKISKVKIVTRNVGFGLGGGGGLCVKSPV